MPGDAPNEERDLQLATMLRNDYGNGQRLVTRFGNELLYVPAGGKNAAVEPGWYVWDGTRWALDEGQCRAQRYAHRTALAIAAEADVLREKQPGDPEDKNNPVKLHFKWAVQSGNGQRVRSMLDQAAPYLAQPACRLDTHTHLFNLLNGTLELTGGVVVMREHRRGDLLTRRAPVAYDPDAPRPHFDKFLNRILPDPQEQVFVQTYLGYALTGDTPEEKMLLCHGDGANGKSTLMQAVMNIFSEGEYGMTLQFESLQKNDRKSGSEATPDIARLPGKRFVLAAEPESGVRLSTSTVKKLTSTEGINARHLNQGFFTFKQEFTMALLFNDKPIVPAQDDGTWRRILMLHFQQQFSEEERDETLRDKLAAEASGILNWLLDGYRIWAERGLQTPISVQAATREYRDENDDTGCFIRSSIMRQDGSQITAKELYTAYQAWCEESGKRPWSQKKLGDSMTKMKFRRRQGGTVVYLDIGFASYVKTKPDSEPPRNWSYDDDPLG